MKISGLEKSKSIIHVYPNIGSEYGGIVKRLRDLRFSPVTWNDDYHAKHADGSYVPEKMQEFPCVWDFPENEFHINWKCDVCDVGLKEAFEAYKHNCVIPELHFDGWPIEATVDAYPRDGIPSIVAVDISEVNNKWGIHFKLLAGLIVTELSLDTHELDSEATDEEIFSYIGEILGRIKKKRTWV